MTAPRLTESVIVLLAVLSGLTACTSGNVHEPWMGGRGEQAKQKWESPPSPHREDEMRTRLLTTQSDH
ncbi:MAG: hypothetical protein ACM3NI_08760 [Bacteroidota bacterium]